MTKQKIKGLDLRETTKKIAGQAVPRGELYIYGDIVSDKWYDEDVAPAAVVELLNEMSTMNVSDIDVYINSPGGSVFSGIAIYSALKRHPAAINVQVDGIAASIASVIMQAGDLISIAEAGMIMVHSPWSMTVGNAEEMRKQASVLDKVETSMIAAYGRTGIDEKTLKSLLAAETWLTGAEAVEMGFADELVQVDAIAAMLVPEDRFKSTPKHLLLPVQSVKTKSPANAPAKSKAKVTAMPDPIDIEEQLKKARDTAAADAKEKAISDEKSRKKHINAVFLKFPAHAELRTQCMDDMDCSAQMAGDKLLEVLAEGAAPLGGSTRVEDLGSEHEKFKAGVIDGALQKVGINERKDGNPYREFSMRDVARVCVANMGMPVEKMGTEAIIRAALTSASDFPVLYENIMHKVLLSAYRVQADTWSEYMQTGVLSDFRAHSRYRLGTFGDLPVLQENGEIVRTTLQDATKETIAAEERGMIFDMSYKAIVDDDLGGLTNIATMMGRSAHRSVENTAYAELVANPTMGDGTALFHADHNNLAASGSVISIASLGAARSAMRRQMDPSSNEFIDLLPAILLCPVELGDLARQVITSETDITKTNSKARNPIQNMVRVVDTPRLSGTEWYLMAAPSDTAIGEVGFLGGSEPKMMMEELFESRGVQWRVTLDFGVAMLEWRAGYMNPGA